MRAAVAVDVQTAAQSAAIKATAGATYGGAGAGFYFGMTANDIAAFAGIAIGTIGLIANIGLTWYYKREHSRLLREQISVQRIHGDRRQHDHGPPPEGERRGHR